MKCSINYNKVAYLMLILECALQWRHNERDGVSNHRRFYCLLNFWFRRRSKKTSKFRVTGRCNAKRPVTLKMFPFDDVNNGCFYLSDRQKVSHLRFHQQTVVFDHWITLPPVDVFILHTEQLRYFHVSNSDHRLSARPEHDFRHTNSKCKRNLRMLLAWW